MNDDKKNLNRYLNKKDILHYLKYGPMDFEWKQAFFYYLIIDLPTYTIIYWTIYFIIKKCNRIGEIL